MNKIAVHAGMTFCTSFLARRESRTKKKTEKQEQDGPAGLETRQLAHSLPDPDKSLSHKTCVLTSSQPDGQCRQLRDSTQESTHSDEPNVVVFVGGYCGNFRGAQTRTKTIMQINPHKSWPTLEPWPGNSSLPLSLFPRLPGLPPQTETHARTHTLSLTHTHTDNASHSSTAPRH